MKKSAIMIVVVMLIGMFLAGCEDATVKTQKNSCGTADKSAKCSQKICPKCGKAKGSKECCKPCRMKCKKCGEIKGSPGCCK